MNKRAVSATLDADLVDRLDALVEETERNRSWLISKAVERLSRSDVATLFTF